MVKKQVKSSSIPWNRYTLLADLIDRLASRPFLLDIDIHQIVFLLEAFYRLDLWTDFTLYMHGPMSRCLHQDLSFLESSRVITLGGRTKDFPYGPFLLVEVLDRGPMERIKSKAIDYLEENSNEMHQLVEDFGMLTTSDLILFSTIVYALKSLVHSQGGNPILLEKFVNIVWRIRPRVNIENIERSIEKLVDMGYISTVESESGKKLLSLASNPLRRR